MQNAFEQQYIYIHTCILPILKTAVIINCIRVLLSTATIMNLKKDYAEKGKQKYIIAELLFK